MSTYIHFFIRGETRFYPLYTANRSETVYDYFASMAPWEKLTPLSSATLESIKNDIRTDIKEFKERRQKEREIIGKIGSFNNTLKEKLEAIDEIQSTISYMDEEITKMEWTIDFINFLGEILEEAEDTKYYEDVLPIDVDNYLYVGMECGISPTFDMIES